LKFFHHGDGRHLGFVRTVNSAVRSAVPENPTLEPNMKWIGSPVANLGVFPLEQTRRHVGVAKVVVTRTSLHVCECSFKSYLLVSK